MAANSGRSSLEAQQLKSVPDDGTEKVFVGPEDLAGFDPAIALGEPGAFPYTRGVHRTM